MSNGRWLVIGMFLLGALAIGGDGSKEPTAPTAAPVMSPQAAPAEHMTQDQTAPRARTVEEQLSQSTEGLREVPSPVPNGGTMVHLRGRFKNTMVLTSDAGGPPDARCVNDTDLLPKPNQKRTPAENESD